MLNHPGYTIEEIDGIFAAKVLAEFDGLPNSISESEMRGSGSMEESLLTEQENNSLSFFKQSNMDIGLFSDK